MEALLARELGLTLGIELIFFFGWLAKENIILFWVKQEIFL